MYQLPHLVAAMAMAGLCRVGKGTDYTAAGPTGPQLVRGALLLPRIARVSVGGRITVDVRTQHNITHGETQLFFTPQCFTASNAHVGLCW